MTSYLTQHRSPVTAALCCLAWWLASTVWAQPDGPQQVVLLRNGRVLEAEVFLSVDQCTLRFKSGAELRIDSDEIDLLGDDYEHLHQQMQQRTSREQTSERIKIVNFCLNHDLLDAARQELQWLKEDGLDEDTVKRLDDKIEASMRLANSAATRPAVSASSQPAMPSGHAQNFGPGKGNPADHLDDGDQPPIDLESFGLFVRYVQPHLLIGCSQALCHGSKAENGFRLARLEHGATPPRSMSQRNFRTVNQWLSGHDSTLLMEKALAAHGGQRKAAWTDRDRGAQMLAAWMEAVAATQPTGEEPRLVIRPVQFLEVAEGKTSGASEATGNDAMQVVLDYEPDPYDPSIFKRWQMQREAMRAAARARALEAEQSDERLDNSADESATAPPRSVGPETRYPSEVPPRQSSRKD